MAKKKAPRSMPQQIALVCAADLVCMAVLTIAASALVRAGVIGQGRIHTAALAANTMAVFLGSLLAIRGCAQKKLPAAMAGCTGYLVLLLLGNLAFVSAPPGGIVWVAAPAIGCAFLASVLASRNPKPKHKRV